MKRETALLLGRLGVSWSRGGTHAVLRGLALAGGAALMVLMALMAVVTGSTAALRQERTESLWPVPAASADQASALYGWQGFAQVGLESVTVIVLEPLTEDAPLPPGVRAWPMPGEAVVSPALRSDLAESDPSLFGPVAGVIGPEGLETPVDRRVYIRPADVAALDPDLLMPIVGFGGPQAQEAYGTGYLYAQESALVNLLIFGGIGVPAMGTLFLAASLGSAASQRRTSILAAVGASRSHLGLLALGEVTIPVILGALVGALPVAVASWWDVQLFGTLFPAADVRRCVPWLLLAWVVGIALTLGIVLAARQGLRLFDRRHLLGASQSLPLGRAVAAVGIALGVVAFTFQSQSALWRTVVYVVGVGAVALLLPALVGTIVGALGALLARVGQRVGSPASVLGGRRFERFSARIGHLTIGVGLAILVLGQVQLYAAAMSAEYYAAQASLDRWGVPVAAAGTEAYGTGLDRFIAALPPGVEPWWVEQIEPLPGDPQQRSTSVIHTDCAGAKALGRDCGPEEKHIEQFQGTELLDRVTESYAFGEDVIVRADGVDDVALRAAGAQIGFMSTTGGDLPIDELNQIAYRTIPGGLQIKDENTGWLVVGDDKLRVSQWTIFVGVLGVAAVALAAACAVASEVLRSGRDIGPLAVASGRRRWVLALAFYRTAVPITVAGIVAAAFYYLLPTGLTRQLNYVTGATYLEPSETYVLASVIAATALGLIIATITAVAMVRDSARWRPGGSA